MVVVVYTTAFPCVLYLRGQTKRSFSFHGRWKTTLILIVSWIFQNHLNNSSETKKTVRLKSMTLEGNSKISFAAFPFC